MSLNTMLPKIPLPYRSIMMGINEIRQTVISEMEQSDGKDKPWQYYQYRRAILSMCGLFNIPEPKNSWENINSLQRTHRILQRRLAQELLSKGGDDTHELEAHFKCGCMALVPLSREGTVYKIFTGSEARIASISEDDQGRVVLHMVTDLGKDDIQRDYELLGKHIGFVPTETLYVAPERDFLVVTQPSLNPDDLRCQPSDSSGSRSASARVTSWLGRDEQKKVGTDLSDIMQSWVSSVCGTRIKTYCKQGWNQVSWGAQPLVPLVPIDLPAHGEPIEIDAIIVADMHGGQLGRKKDGSLGCFDRLPHKVLQPEDYTIYAVAAALVSSQEKLRKRYPNHQINLKGYDIALQTVEARRSELRKKHPTISIPDYTESVKKSLAGKSRDC